MHSSNKKYISAIVILLMFIIYETFFPLYLGKKLLIDKQVYNNMQSVCNKYAKQEKVINDVKANFLYTPDNNKIMENSLKGAINGFDDPYTVYMNKKEYQNFLVNVNGSYTGIGVVVKLEKENNAIIIDSVFPSSPAMEAGLKKGDQIVKINGEKININEDLESISSKIKGKENTQVNLTVMRQGNYIDFNMTRKQTEIPTIHSEKMEQDDIGYIKLLGFDNNSSAKFEKALNELQNENIKKLVIDLRGNPGGLLDETVNISSLFLPENSLVTYTKNNKNQKSEYKTTKKNHTIHLPIAILVDENSASATELFTGVMQDNNLATIIGTTTYGKGVIQTIKPYKDGSAIKITIAEYFTPKGQRINKKGIKPDIDLSQEMKEQLLNPAYSSSNIYDDICFKKALEVLK